MTLAVLLAGGRGSRLGLTDKATLEVRGATLLQASLEALASHGVRKVALVGPPRPGLDTPSGLSLVTTREDPPLSGPAAACVAGLAALGDAPPDEPVALLAVDLVWPAGVLSQLLQAPLSGDGAVLVDSQGRRQWLCAVVRCGALTAAATHLGDPRNRSMRELLQPLDLTGITCGDDVTADIDTPADLAGQTTGAVHGPR